MKKCRGPVTRAPTFAFVIAFALASIIYKLTATS